MNVQGLKLKEGLFYVNIIWLQNVTFSKRLHLENASFFCMFEKIFKRADLYLGPCSHRRVIVARKKP